MTEISSPLIAGPDIEQPGLADLPRPPFEMRVGDGNDIELPVGSVGELVVRSRRPWALFSGYHRDPAATVGATRNGWFHTGDAFRVDDRDRFFFVDRLKDVIRRRGENISSFDRKRVVEGKSVSVRVDIGGRRIIKKKRKKANAKYN